MNELPLVLMGGLLGSSHCIGMCGGFALSIGIGARSPWHNLIRQLAYSLGRIFTYGFLGSAAGFAGLWFAGRTGALMAVQAWLSLMAGVILTMQGLSTLGLALPARWKQHLGGAKAACIASSFARPFLRSERWESVFIAGVLNGLLPCGLVYGYLALASSTASLPLGLATMAAFGLGTVPAMMITGVGASLISLTTRRGMFRIAGACVLVTGLVATARGVTSLRSSGTDCSACGPIESHSAEHLRPPARVAGDGPTPSRQ